jgi:heptosyltransferase-2
MSWPDLRPLRILVIRYRFIGDTVLAIPTLRNLREAFPNAVIDVLAEPVSGDTLAHCPYKNELLYYGPRLKGERKRKATFPTTLLGAANFLRARRYDRCYILRRSFSSAILPLLAGIPHRVGFSTEGRNWLLQRSTPYADKHEVECFLDVLRADGIPVTDIHNENWTDPSIDQRVAAALPASGRRRIFLGAKSNNTAKDWRPGRFGALAHWLIGEKFCEIHVSDAPDNRAHYASIREHVPAEAQTHWHDWSTRLTLREIASLLRRMNAYVGVDNGLTHLSASFHVPTVVLYEPWMTKRWRPWDTAQELVLARPQPPHPAFDSIQVDEVRAAVERLLATLPPHP